MATAAKKLDSTAQTGEKKKRSKVKLLIVVFLILLLAGGGGYTALKLLTPKPHHKTAFVPPVVGPLMSFPSITTNLSDGHLIQLTISFQLTVGSLPADLSPLQQKMTDAAILDLSTWTYPQLLIPSAKDQLKRQLLASFNAIVKVATSKDEIAKVFITNFLMQ